MLQKEKRHEGKRPQSASGRQGGGKRRAGGAPGGGGSNGGDGDGDDEDEEDAAEEAEEEEEVEEEEELEDAEFDAQDKKQVFLYMLLLCVLPVVHSFFCKFLPFTSHIFFSFKDSCFRYRNFVPGHTKYILFPFQAPPSLEDILQQREVVRKREAHFCVLYERWHPHPIL